MYYIQDLAAAQSRDISFIGPSHISWKCIEIPELYWEENRINRSHVSERVLGVVETADFENLATQDTL